VGPLIVSHKISPLLAAVKLSGSSHGSLPVRRATSAALNVGEQVGRSATSLRLYTRRLASADATDPGCYNACHRPPVMP